MSVVAAPGTAANAVRGSLKLVFGLVPVVAGLDKFANLLTAWGRYLAPQLAQTLPVGPRTFMHAVGVIEIAAGVGLLLTPWTRVFAWIVALWLFGISLDLILAGYYDVAVRDIVMATSALCLARLSAPELVRTTPPLAERPQGA